jgi:hypothetical protein
VVVVKVQEAAGVKAQEVVKEEAKEEAIGEEEGGKVKGDGAASAADVSGKGADETGTEADAVQAILLVCQYQLDLQLLTTVVMTAQLYVSTAVQVIHTTMTDIMTMATTMMGTTTTTTLMEKIMPMNHTTMSDQ